MPIVIAEACYKRRHHKPVFEKIIIILCKQIINHAYRIYFKFLSFEKNV